MYTQDQIDVAIQKAKKANYSDEQINQAVSQLESAGMIQKKGFLRSVGEAFVNPLLDYGALVGESIGQAAMQPFRASKQKEIDSLLSQQQALLRDQSMSQREKEAKMSQLERQINSISGGIQESAKPMLMTSPKRKYAFENISGNLGEGAMYGTRKGVGAASYLIPAGGAGTTAGARILSAGGRGSLIGAMRAFGEDNSNAGDVAMGGVGGALGGAAFQGLGEAYRGVRGLAPKSADTLKETLTKPLKIRGTALDKKDPYFSSNKKDLQSLSDEVGLQRTMTPEEHSEAIARKMGEWNDEIVGYLDEGKTPKYGDYFKNLDKNLKKLDAYLDDRKAYQNARKEMTKLLSDRIGQGGNRNQLAYELKQELAGDLFSSSGLPKQGIQSDARRALYYSIKDTLDNVSPNIKAINNKQRLLYDLAEEINTTLLKDAPVRVEVPFLSPTGYGRMGVGFNLPWTAGQQSALGAKVGQLPQAIGSRLPQAASGTGTPLLQQLGQQVGQQNLLGNFASGIPARLGSMSGQGGGGATMDNTQGLVGSGTNYLNNMNTSAMQGQGSSVGRRIGLQEWAGRQPVGLPFELQQAINKAAGESGGGELANADKQLDELLRMHGQLLATGAIGGRLSNLSRGFGNKASAAYEAAASSLAVEVAAAMGLKPLSEEEVAEVRLRWLPAPTDSQAQAAAKVNALKRMIMLKNQDTSTLGAGGGALGTTSLGY